MQHTIDRTVGYWSALSVATTLSLFSALLLLSLFGLQTIYWSFVIVMVMGASFVAMLACVYRAADEGRRVYALLGLSFAVMFAAFISIPYYLQLAVVRSNPLALAPETIALIAYEPGSSTFALDMLGFTFLCLSLLALVPLFWAHGLLRWFLLINGLLAAPTFVFPLLLSPAGTTMSGQPGSIALFVWCLVFLPVPVLLTRWFKEVVADPSRP